MQRTNNTAGNHDASVKVWDLFIRVFHWTLVLGFAAAYISAELGAATFHVWAGYYLLVLLMARIYWGFRGSEHARFRSFIYSWSETLQYARSMFTANPKHYLGHNPAGAVMVFTLLGLLLMILATGLVTLAAIDYEGPLLFLANSVSDETAYAVRHLHEFLPIVGLILVALHIVGVVAGSIQHKEHLVRAMLTGKKTPITPPISTK